jgi:hypothetical protein
MVAIKIHVSVLLWTILFCSTIIASSTPVQVDIIFPKENATYQPTFPFPIVFAAHNFSQAWAYRPTLKWSLRRWDAMTKTEYDLSEGGQIGWNEGTNSTWAPPSDKYLTFNSSKKIIYYNASDWILEYQFFLDIDGCNGGTRYKKKKTHFSTSNITGLMPSFNAFSGCSTTIGAITIDAHNGANETCVRLSTLQSPPISCAYKPSQTDFDQLATTMTNITQCDNVTWPESTGIGSQCTSKPKTSEGDKSLISFVVGLSVILPTVFMMLLG